MSKFIESAVNDCLELEKVDESKRKCVRSIYLERGLWDKITECSEKQGVTPTTLIRAILNKVFDEETRAETSAV